jgi:ribosomal protein L9
LAAQIAALTTCSSDLILNQQHLTNQESNNLNKNNTQLSNEKLKLIKSTSQNDSMFLSLTKKSVII